MGERANSLLSRPGLKFLLWFGLLLKLLCAHLPSVNNSTASKLGCSGSCKLERPPRNHSLLWTAAGTPFLPLALAPTDTTPGSGRVQDAWKGVCVTICSPFFLDAASLFLSVPHPCPCVHSTLAQVQNPSLLHHPCHTSHPKHSLF